MVGSNTVQMVGSKTAMTVGGDDVQTTTIVYRGFPACLLPRSTVPRQGPLCPAFGGGTRGSNRAPTTIRGPPVWAVAPRIAIGLPAAAPIMLSHEPEPSAPLAGRGPKGQLPTKNGNTGLLHWARRAGRGRTKKTDERRRMVWLIFQLMEGEPLGGTSSETFLKHTKQNP